MASTMRFDKWENPTGTVSLDITQAIPGLTPIVPASVVLPSGSATVSSTGLISFPTAVSYVRLTGIFTSAFKSYYIVNNIVTSAGVETVVATLWNGGTETATGYRYMISAQSTADAAASKQLSSTSAAYMQSGYYSGGVGYAYRTITVTNPQLAMGTGFIVDGFYDYGTHVKQYGSGLLDNSTQYDGIKFAPITGNISGTIQVYGIR